MKKFWNWIRPQNENEDRILEINGVIAEDSWFDDDVTPEMFKSELHADVNQGPITLWLNSPGGDCIAASQIYTMLIDYRGDVTVKIDGIAASAASVIAMAGTKVLMSPTALMMIHNPATFAFGDHAEMQKTIDMLSEVKESIINAYEIKTGLSRVQLGHMMDDETWMNAKRAIELGFADDLLSDEKSVVENMTGFSFSASMVEKAIACKIDKHPKEDKVEKTETPKGRAIEDLRVALYDKLI